MTSKSVVLDTHLLVLLVVGHVDRSLIERHKNLSAYDVDGFDLLVEVLHGYSQIVLTPNTLTEASNLLRQVREPDRFRITMALGELVRQGNERYVISKDASLETIFGRLGLTDAALMIVARDQTVLLSADNDLYLAASRAGFDVVNFAHLYDARFG